MHVFENDPLAAYLASMPPEYRTAFDLEAASVHEEIVRRRGDRATHVEIWRELSERVVAICVVADDRPGLLTCVSAALVATDIDVVGADAYCRTREDGSREAVDFLWIRRLPSESGSIAPIRTRDVATIGAAIDRAASGTGEVSVETGRARRRKAAAVRAGASARIRFETEPETGVTVLTVEAVDRPGLLLAVTQALFHAGLQIIGLRAMTERGRAIDRFQVVETDGKALRQDRLLTLQIAILGALDEGISARPSLDRVLVNGT